MVYRHRSGCRRTEKNIECASSESRYELQSEGKDRNRHTELTAEGLSVCNESFGRKTAYPGWKEVGRRRGIGAGTIWSEDPGEKPEK